MQVVDNRARVPEREAAVELQPIRRDWNSDGRTWCSGHQGRKCKLSASATSAAMTRNCRERLDPDRQRNRGNVIAVSARPDDPLKISRIDLLHRCRMPSH